MEPSPGYSFQLEFTLFGFPIMYFYDFVLFMASDTGFPFMAVIQSFLLKSIYLSQRISRFKEGTYDDGQTLEKSPKW